MPSFSKEDFPDADIILCTSDDNSLHVHRIILQVASPFFKGPADAQAMHNHDNMIRITEDSRTIHTILSLIYPCSTEPFPSDKSLSLAVLVHLLRTSLKYHFELATSKLINKLITWVNDNPSDSPILYAVGCVLDLKDLVTAGRNGCLKFSTQELLAVRFREKNTQYLMTEEPSTSDIDAGEPDDKPEPERDLQKLLEYFNMSEYQDLLMFHYQRILGVKSLISGIQFYSRYCNTDPNCWRKITSGYKDRLIEEVDAHGPDMENIRDPRHLTEIKQISVCRHCWEDVFNTQFDQQLEKLRGQIP